jgi:hypothetical protein
MADADKNILITPNVGQTSEPVIEFTGANATPLTLRVLDDGTVSFEGTAGQLFSISDGLSGTIFSVNDISGIPSIEVLDDGTVKLAEYGGKLSIGESSFIDFGSGVNKIYLDADISSWEYSQKSFSVNAQETAPTDIFFSSDGTKMYILGDTGNDITQYNLGTAWDVESSTYVTEFSVAAQETAPAGLSFSSDGTKMYVSGLTGVSPTGDYVYRYNLSSAWDISTASYASDSLVSPDTSPQGVYIDSTGNKLYIAGDSGNNIYQYTLGTAYTLSSATLSYTLNVINESSGLRGIDFSSDGTIMYTLGGTRNTVNRYNLSTAWDISTAIYYDSVYIGFQEPDPRGIFVKVTENKAFVVGAFVDTVFQYDTNFPVLRIQSNSNSTESSIIFNNEVRMQNNLFVNGSMASNGDFYTRNIFPTQDSTGVVGNASFTWNNGQFTNLTIDGTLSVRAAIDLSDSDYLRFGASDDAQIWYNGTTNVLNIELEAAATKISITDNGTEKVSILKNGNMNVISPTTAGSIGVRNTTMSTAAPTGGSDGDVWLVYT